MKNKLTCFLLGCSLCVSFTAVSQNVNMQWGAPFSSLGLTYGISGSSEGLVFLSSKGNYPAIQPVVHRFDGSLNFVETKTLSFEQAGKPVQLARAFVLKNRVLVFGTQDEVKEKKRTLYYRQFDRRSLDFAASPEKIMTVEYDFNPFISYGDFVYLISPDSGSVAVVFSPRAVIGKSRELMIMVFDSDLSILYEKKADISFKNKDFSVKAMRLSNEGDVFVLGMLPTEGEKPNRGIVQDRCVLLMITRDDEKPQEINIGLRDHQITDVRIAITPDDNLIAAGIYTDSEAKKTRGFFSILFDPFTRNVLNTSTYDFSADFMHEDMEDVEKGKANKVTAATRERAWLHYGISNLMVLPDNRMVLVAEQKYSRTSSSSSSSSSTTTYYANNIIMAGINRNGEIEYARNIFKRQKSVYYSLASHVMLSSGSKVFFVFTDHKLNLTNDPKEIHYADYSKNGIVTLVTLDVSGEVTRTKLYSCDQYLSFPSSGFSLADGNGKALLHTFKGRKSRLCLLTLD
jgi:hypothetical protein